MIIRDILKQILLSSGTVICAGCRVGKIPAHPGKILVFTRKAIGDLVMAVPAFRALRNHYPDSRIVLCTMEWNRGIAEQLPYFDELMFVDDSVAMNRDVWGIMRFISRLRRQRYDMAVLFDSFMFPFYCALAGIPVRVGYEFKNEGFALTHKVIVSESDYRLQQFLKVVGLTGCNVDDTEMNFTVTQHADDLRHVDRLLEGLPDCSCTVGIVAGGGRNPGQVVEAKNWNSEGFSSVIGALLENHAVRILFFGKDEDALIIEDIMNRLPAAAGERIRNLCNATSISQAAALLKRCQVVVTNDTFLMHLAAAVGTPTVSIFGPTDPANLAPRGAKHHVVRSGLACSPCYEQEGYAACHKECMASIHWERVYEQVVAALTPERSVSGV